MDAPFAVNQAIDPRLAGVVDEVVSLNREIRHLDPGQRRDAPQVTFEALLEAIVIEMACEGIRDAEESYNE